MLFMRRLSSASGPEGFQLLARIETTKKMYFLSLAIEMERFSEDFIIRNWTEQFGLEPKEGYGFLELDDDEELELADWGEKVIKATEVVEYGGMGPSFSDN